MQGLRRNIETLERIGDIDRYITSDKPEIIAQQFASGRYKLVQIGCPLALTDEIPSPQQAHAVLMALA